LVPRNLDPGPPFKVEVKPQIRNAIAIFNASSNHEEHGEISLCIWKVLYMSTNIPPRKENRRDIMHTPQEWDLMPINRCKVPPIVEE
jgi:hypothetical protein